MASSSPTASSSPPSSPPSSSSATKLHPINIANLAAYILNVIITYGVSTFGKFPTNAELSIKYQTLITPSAYAFSIWGIIFLAELIWAIVQMTPQYRATEFVRSGVKYNFIILCLSQIIWNFCFAMEQMTLSLIFMIGILIPLTMIVINLYKISVQTNPGRVMYWLLQFPFEIHAAWIMAATLVNLNVTLVAWEAAPMVQEVVAWICFFIIACISLLALYKSIWVIPLVLTWATFAVAVELANPQELITNTFSDDTISTFKGSAGTLSATIFLLIVIAYLYDILSGPTVVPASAYSALGDVDESR